MDITISFVRVWTSEELVWRAVITWKVGKLINFPIIKSDKWHANDAKRKDVLIPGIVFHLGSERCGKERDISLDFCPGPQTSELH